MPLKTSVFVVASAQGQKSHLSIVGFFWIFKILGWPVYGPASTGTMVPTCGAMPLVAGILDLFCLSF